MRPLIDNIVAAMKKSGGKMDLDRLNYWLGVGAQMSERVAKLKKIAETER